MPLLPAAEPQAAADGRLREAEAQAALSALASPKLDAAEAAILSWVRETVRYTPSQIQKRTRTLSEAIGMEAMLEAVGVAALANATVRLAMLLE